jgi:hypothetical protein
MELLPSAGRSLNKRRFGAMQSKLRIILAGVVLAVLVFAISVAVPRRTEGTVAAAVQVVNPYVPAEVENSSRARFEYNVGISFDTPSVSYPSQIPAGKRLVIDFVSGSCSADPGTSVYSFYINTSQFYPHFFVPVKTASVSYVFSQLTHIYVEPGETFTVTGSFSGPVSCGVEVTGFLVNA